MIKTLSESKVKELWQTNFAKLEALRDGEISSLLDKIQPCLLPPHMIITTRGSLCQQYLLVAEGTVRIQLVTESGREVTLYRIQPGEGCILTTSCLLSQQPFPAEGITETNVVAFTLNERSFNRYLDQSPPFRRFVFQNLGQRFADVLSRIEQIYSPAIDQKLAEILLNLDENSGPIMKTHQDLAIEMGAARETISRHLKRFETHGWVQLHRNAIEIKNKDALGKL